MDFVLVQNGKALGPYAIKAIKERIALGEITKAARIWRPPWNEWAPITEVFPLEFGSTADLFAEMDLRGEIRHKPTEDIFERVTRIIPTANIQALLRAVKEHGGDSAAEIRLTSKNKDELVNNNLREALNLGLVAKSQLESLIQEHEETGGQRIFLYRLQSDHLSKIDPSFDQVGQRLFGKKWDKIEFPIFHQLPEEPEASSFRKYTPQIPKSVRPTFTEAFGSGWILRIDASVRREERLEAETSDVERPAGIVTHTYLPTLQDAVCVIRYWSMPGLLEVRVPNFSSRELVTRLRDNVLNKFGQAFSFGGVYRPWEMAPICTSLLSQLVQKPASEPTLRRVSGSLFRENDRSTMKIEIQNQDETDIRDSGARLDSVKAYLKDGSLVESMIAFFQLRKGEPEIRITLGAEEPNEVSVRKSIGAKELDHVIFRLHANS
jgi:hypothetical protein